MSHTVLGGAGSQINWYEVNTASGGLAQSGVVSSLSLYLLNTGISNDRTCTDTTCAHGDAMVLGFTTTSKSVFPAIQMVSKIGAGPQSGFVLVKQSAKSDKNFSCSPCRWGDYGGATPDPAASLTEIDLEQIEVGYAYHAVVVEIRPYKPALPKLSLDNVEI